MNSERKDGIREIYHQRFTNPHSSGVTNQMQNWDLSLNESILLILLILFLFSPSRNSTTIYIICPVYRNILITILLTNCFVFLNTNYFEFNILLKNYCDFHKYSLFFLVMI